MYSLVSARPSSDEKLKCVHYSSIHIDKLAFAPSGVNEWSFLTERATRTAAEGCGWWGRGRGGGLNLTFFLCHVATFSRVFTVFATLDFRVIILFSLSPPQGFNRKCPENGVSMKLVLTVS